MSSTIFFFIFIPFLSLVLLLVNLIFAPHNPYQEKESAFECGFHSFLGQNRTQFSISFFIFALLFLLFDLEILLVYPYIVSAYSNNIYGLLIMLVFFTALTIGLGYELGKKALNIDSRQILNNSYKKYFIKPELSASYANVTVKHSSVFILSIFYWLVYYLAVFAVFISSFFFYNYLLKSILTNKYFIKYIPFDFAYKLKTKTSFRDKIKFLFSIEYMTVAIPATFIVLTVNLLHFYLTGNTILDNNSSYIAIFLYSLSICTFFSSISCYLNNTYFLSKSNVFSLFYFSILLFLARVTLLEALPVMLPIIFFYLDIYAITEHISVYLFSVSKFFKSFLSNIPVFNKLSFVFNEKGVNSLNIQVHIHKYIDIFANKNKVLIYKPRLSIPIHFVSFNSKVNTLQLINPILKNTVVFKSFVVMSKGFNYLKVFSISVTNYKNLNVSLIHIDNVGDLQNFFSNSKNGFLKLTTIKSNFVQLEKSIIIIYPRNFNFTNSNQTEALRYADLITKKKNNYFLVSASNITKTAHNTDFFKTLDLLKKADVKFNSGLNNYLNDVTNNIPYEIVNPIVYMMNDHDIDVNASGDKGKGIASIQDTYLPDTKDLERALTEYKGLDEDNVFELVSEQAEYLSVCLFFNDLDRVNYALNLADTNKEIIMQDEQLKKDYDKLIEPIVSQYSAFFDEQVGHLNDCIRSLENIYIYLMTDEYKEMSDYIAKLGQEIGAKFVEDKNMLSDDQFRHRILIRESIHNFLVRSKIHFEDLLEKDDKKQASDKAKLISTDTKKHTLEKEKEFRVKNKANKSAYDKKYYQEHKGENRKYWTKKHSKEKE